MALVILLSFLATLYIITKFHGYRKALQSIRGHPGYRVLIDPRTIVSSIGSFIPRVKLGNDWAFRDKYTAFEKFGWDVHSVVCVWPIPQALLFIADPVAINAVSTSRKFPKDLTSYSMLNFFGANIVISNGQVWKRHRKVAAPAFAERNYKLVWGESVYATLALFHDVWKDKEVVEVDNCLDVTTSLSLMVFSAASFGRRLSWTDGGQIPAGHRMLFKDALRMVSADIHVKMVLPKWMMGLTAYLRRVQLAFDEMEDYIHEMVASRRTSEKLSDRHDLLSRLIEANEEDGETQLTDQELLSNVSIFITAGHETASAALCFALVLLALHQDEQSKLCEHIKQVLPDGRLPSYEDMPSLRYSLATLYEALRMIPPVTVLPKVAAEDTVVRTTNSMGEQKLVVVPAGTVVSLHVPGLHYNPRYWEDPHTFKPSRFLGEWPSHAFVPFNAGPRTCLGKKFFETEAVAALTLLVLRYKIDIKEDPEFLGETFEEKKTRILKTWQELTAKIRVPLTFKLRSSTKYSQDLPSYI